MVRLLVLLSVLSLSAPATLAANGHAIKQRADAVLTLMSYTVVPDVTASDLNIGSGSNDKHNLAITQFGGGATLSESFPLYLEGTMGYSRYDPRFVVSNGEQTRNVPTKWNSLTTTGGVGWDFSLHRDSFGGNLVLRPIVNVMLGTLAQRCAPRQLGNRAKNQRRSAIPRRRSVQCMGARRGVDAGLRTLFRHPGY